VGVRVGLAARLHGHAGVTLQVETIAAELQADVARIPTTLAPAFVGGYSPRTMALTTARCLGSPRENAR
jgi:hypothetical protein